MRTNQFTLGFDCKQMLTPVARVANNSEILHGMERDCVLDRVISQDAHHLKHVPAVHQGALRRTVMALCDSGSRRWDWQGEDRREAADRVCEKSALSRR
jgi:hypothetical protein